MLILTQLQGQAARLVQPGLANPRAHLSAHTGSSSPPASSRSPAASLGLAASARRAAVPPASPAPPPEPSAQPERTPHAAGRRRRLRLTRLRSAVSQRKRQQKKSIERTKPDADAAKHVSPAVSSRSRSVTCQIEREQRPEAGPRDVPPPTVETTTRPSVHVCSSICASASAAESAPSLSSICWKVWPVSC